MKKILLFVAAAILAVSQSAYAVTIGANELLGTVVPGVPANEDNAMVQVNGLLEGWGVVSGYNDGAATGSVLGNNPSDPNSEIYTLKYSVSTVIPFPAPMATSYNPAVITSNPTFNLGAATYDWVLAKWGPDSAVYYIGNLAANTQVTLSLGRHRFRDSRTRSLPLRPIQWQNHQHPGRRLDRCTAGLGPGCLRHVAPEIRSELDLASGSQGARGKTALRPFFSFYRRANQTSEILTKLIESAGVSGNAFRRNVFVYLVLR